MRCVSRIVHVPVVLYHGCGVRFVFFHVATAYTLSLYGLLLLVCLLAIYVASHAQIEGQIKEDFNASESASIAISGSTFPVKQPRVRTSVILPKLGTAICSASGRATPTDARALLTQEIPKIQKLHSSSVTAVVDTETGSNGVSDTSLARMSSSPARRAHFGELDAPAHPRLLECRARGIKFS